MNNNLLRSIFYLIYIILIGLISIIGDQFNNYLFSLHATTFRLVYFWFLPIYPFLIGLLIALPNFIIAARMPGSWHVNWVKLLVVGIPSLYIAFTHIIYFSGTSDLFPFIYYKQLYIIGGIMFGYSLLASFNKQSQS